MDVFDRMEHLMSRQGVKKSDLMRRLGQDRAQYDRWKAARKIPGKYYAAIAQALNTSIGFLCGEVDAPQAASTPSMEGAYPPGMGPVRVYGGPPMATVLPPTTPPQGGVALPPTPQQAQMIQRITHSLYGLDEEALGLVADFIAMYKARKQASLPYSTIR